MSLWNGLFPKWGDGHELWRTWVCGIRYLFVGSHDNNIKEFDIDKKIMIKEIIRHSGIVVVIKPVKDKRGNIFIVSYC